MAKKVTKKKIVKKSVPKAKRNFKKPRKGKSTDGMEYWKKGQQAAAKASQGNQWWALRTKHGRDKIFATPEILWEAACEYFQAVDDNPLIEVKPIVTSDGGMMGSSINMQEVPHKRPYTMQGLCRYLHVNTVYFNVFKRQCDDEDFNKVIRMIEETIYEQKFEGATSGFFNANIISRDLGLVDKSENVNIEKKAVSDLFPNELKE
jgi:hypothetical protein